MKKDLENFIAAHREEFDDQQVPESLWNGVLDGLEKQESEKQESKKQEPEKQESETQEVERNGQKNQKDPLVQKRLDGSQWFKIAATLLVAGVLGITIYFYGKQQGYEDYARINPELAAARADYQQLVQLRKDSVMVFANLNLGLESEFEEALAYMESNYLTLKKELESSPNQERTLVAMIMNLQAQAEVLNQQLIILSKLNNPPNEKL